MARRAVVVGASSGIGAALVRSLARAGYEVAAVARDEGRLDRLCAEVGERGPGRARPYVHDVTDAASVRPAFDRIREELGGIDVLVYSSGVMPAVREDEFDPDIDRHIVEVNVIGAMAWLDLGAAHFQAQRSGTLVGIGSVAGERGRRGNPAYCASKAALHTFLESLRNRLSRHGVRVITIKPGPVDTPMTANAPKPMAISAEAAAEAIHDAIARGREIVYVPRRWALIMAVVRNIPSAVFRHLSL